MASNEGPDAVAGSGPPYDRGEPTMPESINRTFICSVLFLDIVEYSQRSVAEQIVLKERFNIVLTEAIAGVASDDRIILDTGDGAAVSFLGDPEDAMFAGLSLRDAIIAAAADTTGGLRLQIRVGVNVGPVRLVKDINGQPNIIGDGINVAQRIMSFSEPGQILVSRSYYDIITRLSEDYINLFRYEGAKTDKHVREHEVYAVSTAPSNLRRPTPAAPIKRSAWLAGLGAWFAGSGVRLGRQIGRVGRIARVQLRKWAGMLAVNSKLLVAAPLTFLLIVGTGVVARAHRSPGGEARPGPAPKVESPSVKVAAIGTPPASAEEPDAAPKPEEEVAPRRGAVMVSIAALPWAEVYVDGTRLGVSPPLRDVSVSPGTHRIELRNSSFPAHVQTIDAKSGARISIKHRFRR
ncbi:MAG TPA: adenylate/guanylate cyclase domain-containing protein [Burkholderiales bacterium]|nr:adenylate/guanylate cyclase domain-containing protein [Burkholderiales bacterium]